MPSAKKPTKTSIVRAVATPVPEASNDAAELKPIEAPVPAGAAQAQRGDKAPRPDKPRKPKLVRDSFTIPKAEYGAIEELKLRAARMGQPVKKSELLRAGLLALAGLPDEELGACLAAVPRVKTGRPAKA